MACIENRKLNLTEEERRKLLEMEFTYHGAGNPYTRNKPSSLHEDAEHVRAMVIAVNPERAPLFQQMLGATKSGPE